MLTLFYRSHDLTLCCRDDLKQRKLVRMDSVSGLPYPAKMNWIISNDIIQDMDMARFSMDK